MEEQNKKKGALGSFMAKQAAPRAAAAASEESEQKPTATRKGRRSLRDGREQMLVYLRPEGIYQLKEAVLRAEGESVSAIVAAAVNEWLVKHQRPPVA
jgi:hypothetical protein